MCQASSTPPPRHIPKELLNEFTMNGAVEIRHWYFDGRFSSRDLPRFTESLLQAKFSRLQNKQHLTYIDDRLLHELFSEYSSIIKNKSVIIPGSQTLSFEAYAFFYGAKNVHSIDYQPIITELQRNFTFELVDDFWAHPSEFDLGISYSNFEHDGLGRYGDPINPNGDLIAMQK